MQKKLTVIGATGKLAVPIINRLTENGVSVTGIVRNKEKALASLPKSVSVIEADLTNTESLKEALNDTEYLYLNLSAHDPNATFQAEIDGVKNVLLATQNSPLKQILKISGIGALHPEFNRKGEVFDINKIRLKGHQLIKDSGIAYTIFHPTWFLNALPWFMKGNDFNVYGEDENPIFWSNTTDFADQLANAIGNETVYNKDLAVQGREAMTFAQAAERFIPIFNDDLKIKYLPITPEMGRFGKLLSYFENMKEQFVSHELWEKLGEPKVSFNDFIQSIKS